jgi:hypothetical protein
MTQIFLYAGIYNYSKTIVSLSSEGWAEMAEIASFLRY